MTWNEGTFSLARLFRQPQASRGFVVLRASPRLVDVPSQSRMLVDFSLDFTAQTCLRTNLGVRRALQAMAPGQVLEIRSDNVSAVETIPFMLESHACEHLGTAAFDGRWAVYVRKSSHQEEAAPCK